MMVRARSHGLRVPAEAQTQGIGLIKKIATSTVSCSIQFLKPHFTCTDLSGRPERGSSFGAWRMDQEFGSANPLYDLLKFSKTLQEKSYRSPAILGGLSLGPVRGFP
jgi:hypothetical protein